ncbi:hypothetical protein CQ047_17430 [Microbacterium sp. MYb72]|uniref:hypothetical protein n=1 Tax=Microbacterium sp. MYb72 TaxID=1848693 RepID=UPI000CFDD31E|nr:hypothetical protein [Microbacterium sp. MYb72]PRB03405.1 hypothetical protein CQ047_17430 [Microbacterium sp. MYb72]
MKRWARTTAIAAAITMGITLGGPVAAQAVEDESGIRYDTVFAWSYLGISGSGAFMYTNQLGGVVHASDYIGGSFYGTEQELAEEIGRAGGGG